MKKVFDLISLRGRTVLITGAAGSLGQEIANTVAELGGDLLLVDRPGEDYSSIVKNIQDNWDVSVSCFNFDLESEFERKKLIDEVNSYGQIDVLFNNAAFVGDSQLDGWSTEFENQTVETWRRAFEVNLTAPFDLSKGLFPNLQNSANGSIINIASIYGINAPDYSLYKDTDMGNPAAYSASKGGLIQFTKWLATTLAPNIRVNAISPGGIYRAQSRIFVDRYESRTPLKRMAKEEDFKGAIAYLSTDLSEYVTGQNIVIDGGWGLW